MSHSRADKEATNDSTSRSTGKRKTCDLLVVDVAENSNGDGTPTANDIQFHKDLYNRLKVSRLHPIWVTAEECLRKDSPSPDVVIMLQFKGPVFEHLLALKMRLYGSVAALQCMMNGDRLPKWNHPILSTTLKDCVVCFTGIEQQVRESKTQCIHSMNGLVSKDLNDRTTHLVTFECSPSSAKYKAAVKASMPVLSMDWIDKAWDASLKSYTLWFGEQDIYNEYTLKLFSGCVISCSGLSSSERMTVSQIVKVNGGVFSPAMERNKCTHLLTDKNSGEKYRRAREWGWNSIKICKLKWLDRCIDKGMRLEERHYEPKFSMLAKTSTPQNDSAPPAHFDVSCLTGPRHATVTSRANTTTSPLATSSTSRVTASELGNSSIASPDSSSIRNRSSVPLRRNYSSRSILDVVLPDPVEAIGLAVDASLDCLEHCRLLLCGFTEEELPQWKKVVNVLGATRMPDLYADVTHVVVGPRTLTSDLIEKIKEVSSCVSVVTWQWLIRCGKEQRMVDEKDLLHPMVWDKAQLQTPKAVSTKQTVTRPVQRRSVQLAEVKEVDSLFEGLKIGTDGMDEALEDDLKITVLEMGGEYGKDGERVDYLILPLMHFGSVDDLMGINARNVVSIYWMQDSIEKGQVQDVNSHPLYRPIKIESNSDVLNGCVVALSSMSNLDKETYTELLGAMGAIVQNRLVKRGGGAGGLQRNTHVVTSKLCDRTECAKKWNVPVMNQAWVIESVIKNCKQPVEQFEFDESPLKGYTRSDELWHALREGGRKQSITAQSSVRIERNSVRDSNSTAAEYGEGHGLARGGNKDDGDDDVVVLGTPINKRVKNLRGDASQLPSTSSSPLMDTPSKFLDPNSKFIPRFDLREAYAVVDALQSGSASSLSTTNDSNWSESMVGHVLEEAAINTADKQAEIVVVPSPSAQIPSVPKKDPKRKLPRGTTRNILSKMDSEIGAWRKLDVNKSADNSKNKTLARKNTAPIDDQDPNSAERKRNLTKQQMMMEKLAGLAARRDEEEDVSTESLRSAKENSEKSSERKRKRGKEAPQGNFQRAANPIGWEEAPIVYSEKKGKEARQKENLGSDVAKGEDCVIEPGSSKRSKQDVSRKEEAISKDIARKEKNVSIPSTSTSTVRNDTATARVTETVTAKIVEEPRTKKFVFTSIKLEERSRLGQLVKKLGGEISEEVDSTTTHLCCGAMVRNAKLMKAISAGKYVLLPDFITASSKAGVWLKETEYEWGESNSTTKSIEGKQAKLATAALRWRNHILQTGKKAFEGWQVLFYCGRRRIHDLASIVEAGGGLWHNRVDVSLSPTSLSSFTLALVEATEEWTEKEMDVLIENGIRCYPLDYLSTYLMEENMDAKKYLHKDYAARMAIKQGEA